MVKDLIGQRFGRLTVIARDGSDKKGNAKWLCKCDCGNTKSIISGSLRAGLTKSCGCLRVDTTKANINLGKCGMRRKDLEGQKIGKLTVLDDYHWDGKYGFWKCRCDCGNITFVETGHLKRKEILSCGCLKKSKGELKICKLLKDNNIEFEEQKTFENCRFEDSKWLARFDFWIKNKYLLEYDGDLHYFSKDCGWNNEKLLKTTREHDNFKNKWCKENNIPLIRIPYTHYNELSIKDIMLETSKFIV